MPESIKLYFQNNKRNAKTPIWMFSGIIAFFILLLFTYIIGTKNHELQVKNMLKVKKGDAFGYRVSNDLFQIYKFSKITEDTLYYIESKNNFLSKDELREFPEHVDSLFSSNQNKLTRKEYFKLIDNLKLFEIEK